MNTAKKTTSARRLTLRMETLRELGGKEMHAAAGGAATYTNIPTQCKCTGYYPSLNAPCTTALSLPC